MDLHHAVPEATLRSPSIPAPARHTAILVAVVGAAAAAGAALGLFTGSQTGAVDPDLALLIRFMAAIKAAMALAAAGLVAWRFEGPIAPKLAAAYIAAVALMAVAPGLVWFQSSLTLAGAAFHTGLLAGLGLALRDGGRKPASWPAEPSPHASSASRHLRTP